MSNQGEIEAAICEGMAQFAVEIMGRRPREVTTHLLGDMLIVRLQGVVATAEQVAAQELPATKGRDLLKQVRTQMVEACRPTMEALVTEVTGVAVRSLHHDISTVTGEEIVVFTLAEAPQVESLRK